MESTAPQADIPHLLKGQKAIVTGGSSGIGKGIAIGLAQAGADVVINYHSKQEEAEEVAKVVKSHGARALCVQADVSQEEQVLSMFAEAKKSFGRVDILINNAGLQQDSPFPEMTLEKWNRVIGINLTGQFLCAREAVKAFLNQEKGPSVAAGKILCISSVHEVIPWTNHANYATSKGGIHMLMQSMAQELAPKKIRVNSIGPGAIRTPMAASERQRTSRELLFFSPQISPTTSTVLRFLSMGE